MGPPARDLRYGWFTVSRAKGPMLLWRFLFIGIFGRFESSMGPPARDLRYGWFTVSRAKGPMLLWRFLFIGIFGRFESSMGPPALSLPTSRAIAFSD